MEKAIEAKSIIEEEANNWWKELEEKDKQGQFFASAAGFIAMGEK